MTQPVSVYRWDDPGAPQLDVVSPSRIIDILRKCLVNGYGTKDPLGWTVAFEDVGTLKIAFRNSTSDGSGGYVQFWSFTGNDATTAMYAQVAQGMTALDTFFNPGYQGGITPTSTLKKWILIGTASGFYIIFHSDSVGYPASNVNVERTYYFGDMISSVTNDVSTMIGLTRNGLSTTTGGISSTTADRPPLNSDDFMGTTINGGTFGNNSVLLPTSPAGGATPSQMAPIVLGLDATAISSSSALATAVTYLPLFFRRATNLTATIGDSTDQPFIRGKLPGLLAMSFSAYKDQSFPFTLTINGELHYLVGSSRGTGTQGGGFCMINSIAWEDRNV